MKSLLDRFSQPLPIEAYRTLVNPLWSSGLRGVVEDVRPLTPDAVAVTIRTNRRWPGHRAGQFVTVGVEVDGVRHHRCYSLTTAATAPGTRRIEIAVRRQPDGIVSTHVWRALRSGDVLHLDAPAGDFTLPVYVPERLLFVAAGSGITPLLGMLRDLAGRPPLADVVVLHHAPTAEQTMFAAELADLAASLPWLTVHVEHTQDGGARLDARTLELRCPDWRDREAFVCGPAPLIDFATTHWADHDRIGRLHLERFTLDLPERPAPDAAAETVTASFGRSSITTDAPVGATLLVTAEAAGVAAPYGCRTGICHTCSTRLVSGCTADVRDGRVSEPGEHVQLCVSTPLTDVSLDL